MDRGLRYVILGAASAGCAVCIFGYYLYTQKRSGDKRESDLRKKIDLIQKDIVKLQSEIDDLKHIVDSQVVHEEIPEKNVQYLTTAESSSEDEFFEASDLALGSCTLFKEQNGALPSAPVEINELLINLLKQVDQLLVSDNSFDKERAYNMMMDKYSLVSRNSLALCKLAKATFRYSQLFLGQESDTEMRRTLLFNARDYAFQALALAEEQSCVDSEIQKWCAITTGSLSDFQSTGDKIKSGHVFWQHIMEAIRLNPSDASLHFLLGRWCYAVAELSWIERRVATALFGSPPSSTYDEALQEFREANRLFNAPWLENMLYVAKCYAALGDKTTAIEWLKKASVLPAKSPDEKVALAEVETLLAKL